jgi:hypothetical protein
MQQTCSFHTYAFVCTYPGANLVVGRGHNHQVGKLTSFVFMLKQMGILGMCNCKILYCIQVIVLLAKCHISLCNLLGSCLKFCNKKFGLMMCGTINKNVKSKTSRL